MELIKIVSAVVFLGLLMVTMIHEDLDTKNLGISVVIASLIAGIVALCAI